MARQHGDVQPDHVDHRLEEKMMDYELKEILVKEGYRVHTGLTLQRMKKEELISIIHCLENNWAKAEMCYQNAVKFSEDLIKRSKEKANEEND